MTVCLRCHSLLHEGLLVLRVEEDGRITPLDRDRRPLRSGERTREILENGSEDSPLTLTERTTCFEASPSEEGNEASESARPVAATSGLDVFAVEDLPAELTAAEWRALGPMLEWNASRRAHVLRAESAGIVNAPARPQTSSDAPKNDAPASSSLPPEGFEDFVGEERILESLRIARDAAAMRGEALGHVLLSGPPGLGKTSLARLLARESGRSLHTALGGQLSDPALILSLLTNLALSTVAEMRVYPMI